METQTQTFFMISSIGFVLLWILTAVLLFYIIRAVRTFSSIMDKLENSLDTIGDTTKELLDDARNSFIYNLIFKKKARRKEHK